MKTKTKMLLTSALMGIAALGMVVGQTYALFTSSDSAEISVTAGKVGVSLSAGTIKAYSASLTSTPVEKDTVAGTEEINASDSKWAGSGQEDHQATYYYEKQSVAYSNGGYTGVYFSNGGYVAQKGGNVVLNNISPGDKTSFTITLNNLSNIDINSRVYIDVDTTKDYSVNPNGINDAYNLFAALKKVLPNLEAWSLWATGDEATKELSFDFELPILETRYEGILLYLTIKVEAVQANAYVKDLTRLSISDSVTAANNELKRDEYIYPTQSLNLLSSPVRENLLSSGEDLEEGQYLVWLDEYNLYGVKYGFGDSLLVNTTLGDITASSKANIWYVVETADDFESAGTAGYSTYLNYEVTGNVDVLGSIDTGTNTDIDLVYENKTETAKDLIIRTGSALATLTIDDESDSTIKHYDELGQLTIKQCAMDSYYENGTVAFATIKKGHIVAEQNGEIELLYKDAENATDVQAEQIDNGRIHHAHANSQTLAANKDGDDDLNVTFDYPTYEGDAPTTVHHPDGEDFSVEEEGAELVAQAIYEEVAEERTFDIPEDAAVYNVELNKFYTTLEASIDEAQDEEGTSHLLICNDVTYSESRTIVKKIEINANEKTITNGCEKGAEGALIVGKDGNLTINGNGNWVTSGTAEDLLYIDGDSEEAHGAKVLIEDGTFTSAHVPVYCGRNTGKNAYYRELTINGGTFISTAKGYGCYAVCVYGSNAEFNFVDGTVQTAGYSTSYGSYGVCIFAGATINVGDEETHEGPSITSELACIGTNGALDPYTINIYGGTFTSKTPVMNSGHDDRLVLQIGSSGDQAGSSITCNISGGTFVQENAVGHIFGFRYAGTKIVNISGGTFTTAGGAIFAFRRAEAKNATTINNSSSNVFTVEDEMIY